MRFSNLYEMVRDQKQMLKLGIIEMVTISKGPAYARSITNNAQNKMQNDGQKTFSSEWVIYMYIRYLAAARLNIYLNVAPTGFRIFVLSKNKSVQFEKCSAQTVHHHVLRTIYNWKWPESHPW